MVFLMWKFTFVFLGLEINKVFSVTLISEGSSKTDLIKYPENELIPNGPVKTTTVLSNSTSKINTTYRRQFDDDAHLTIPSTTEASRNKQVQEAATRFTTPSTTVKRYHRTTPRRVSFVEDCDYLAYYCLKAYDTGILCARTLYYNYHTFKNYCLMDYVNCMERYEMWQVVHMGECYNIKPMTEYVVYPYDDDHFLDQYYIIEDN